MNYTERQCERVVPFPIDSDQNGQIKIKLHSERGESNWLNITPDQFRAIERILVGDEK